MATRNPTRPPEPETLFPGRPSIIVSAHEFSDVFRVEYCGLAADLIAAGVMQAAWAERSGKHPRDPDGGKVSVRRFWHSVDGKQQRYCCVERRRARNGKYDCWPGAVEAIKTYEAYRAQYPLSEWIRDRLDGYPMPGEDAPPQLPKAPVLRLVVDNARAPTRAPTADGPEADADPMDRIAHLCGGICGRLDQRDPAKREQILAILERVYASL